MDMAISELSDYDLETEKFDSYCRAYIDRVQNPT